MIVRVAAVGTASTGKSALLNALFGTAFSVDARAGSTTVPSRAFASFQGTELEVIDTPPLEGQDLPVNADVFLLVCDKDVTQAEYSAALTISQAGGQLLVALNKADTYTESQGSQLMSHIRERLQPMVPAARVVACAADPLRLVVDVRPDGSMVERAAPARPQVDEVLPVLSDAIEEARNSLRVLSREYARQAAGLVKSAASSSWSKLRGYRGD